MNIWIMRHGEASFNATSDSQRSLTPLGQQMAERQGRWLAERLQAQQQILDKILVSPLLRTQQTLTYINKGMQAVNFSQNLSELVEIWQGITPSGNPDNVKNYLTFLYETGYKNVLIISYLPLVYDLVLSITCQQSHIHFYPAVIAEIAWQSDFGTLVATQKP
ncbi:phosphohistidine phosphatase SixA [[Haemophilus] ducreyi]|uniref:Phosphohistidine phosphatase n=2 Tax=Haemophilus ducreyi TaxID=730 RepID=Q7VNP3_HAEDU|nr:phosphohistidine phosphatase SixA [[Haemophilus] ducreyi]AAP95409.1 putative phosphohistidine phosphatase [[Haemophilus] ducreyi 35000HP]AKO30520.1 phosphohistidine phosphatase [[Haemophilus] ducreyi]AKO31955.1 phosphohistidine phosphatase [[Haemophilus] ducreyi]AKO33410.1 phosphohistidine phosphatase [[Haemophilus] ducreyi]AKO34857.1 phosphohistidine phosphatase [[Haemophilus] ducreyi]